MADEIPAFRKPNTKNEAEFHLVAAEVPGCYRLQQQFEYVKPDYAAGPNGYKVVAPSDLRRFRTDLASVPFFATWLVPRDGKHTPAALLHDSLYADARAIGSTKDRIRALQTADWVFRGAMDVTRVSLVRRWLMWAAVSVATFSKGSLGRRIWGWFAISVTVAASLVFNLMSVNNIFDGSLEWAPRAAGHVLEWTHGTWLGALLPSDLRWVPLLSLWEVGLVAVLSSLLWTRSAGTALLAAGAVMLFGYPMVLAAWSFLVYWFIEAPIAVVLKKWGRRANDVGILRTKRSVSRDLHVG